MKKFKPGDKIQDMQLRDIYHDPVSIPDSSQVVHLQFRRFSGCPICNIHMGQLMSRKDEILKHHIKEVIVFYSTESSIKENLGQIPFTLISDPKKVLYQQFGVEKSIKSVMNPLAWPAAMTGFFKNITRALRMLPKGDESMFGLPADFLIDSKGTIINVKYGTHAYDQWSVDELIANLK